MTADEAARREQAYRVRDDVEPGSGVAIEPARLDKVVAVRFPLDTDLHLRALAAAWGCTVSDIVRVAVERMVQPIGWRCEHYTVTSAAGVLAAPTSCGCDHQPVYAA